MWYEHKLSHEEVNNLYVGEFSFVSEFIIVSYVYKWLLNTSFYSKVK